MISPSGARVALLIALSASSVVAFRPAFSTPAQCRELSISWPSFDFPGTASVTEISVSLVPIENHAHVTPEPYTLAIPAAGATAGNGRFQIPALPFPGGTQFFASAHIPGFSGPVRRTVSNVMTVEHSSDSSCLAAIPSLDKRRAKAFGKRQINVIGATTQPADGLPPSDPPTSSAAAPVNVIGVGVVPADGGDITPISTSSAPAASSSGAPPINVIGVGQIPANGDVPDTPGNVAPAPLLSSSAPAPPINVIGTSFFTATPAPEGEPPSTTNEAFVPDFTTVEGVPDNAETTDSTNIWETAPAATETPSADNSYDYDYNYGNEGEHSNDYSGGSYYESVESEESQPCTDGEEPTSTSEEYPHETSSSETVAPAVVTYDSFDDMVNAANSMFHAWNPYKPAYTPSF